ncbi:MAG: TetR/AcrR family transcriptional regulator [Thermoleophilia bacterium]
MTAAPKSPGSEIRPGLRERKKALTRRAISDVATRLFIERGFDAVTLAEVAEEAGVSVKTVFNYFGSKEELFLDREEEIHEAMVSAVRDRPAGTTVTEAFGRLLVESWPAEDEGWDALDDPESRERLRGFLIAWRDAPSVRGRALAANDRIQDRLGAALAAESGRDEGDPRVLAMSGLMVAAVNLRHRTLTEGVLRRDPPAAVKRSVAAVVTEVLGAAALAFPEMNRPM